MKKINWQYTLGEILIVIIGITIAFSLNKCADDAKNKDQRIQYITSLKSDIESDKLILEKNIKAIEDKIKIIDEILPKLNTNAPDKMRFVGKIFGIFGLKDFIPKDNTYKALVNSGDLKLIDDFDMKTAIEKHYSYYETMLKSYLRLENIQKEYVANYFIYNTDFEDFKNNEFGFKDEKLLKSIIVSMDASFDIKLKATQKGVESCNELLAQMR